MYKKLLIVIFIIASISGYSQEKDKLFEDSYKLLNGMLHDEQTYSFKKAVFSVENAYLDGNLDTVTVNKQIRVLHNLSETLIKERFLAYLEKDKVTVNKWASIFEVMCDTIPLVIEGKEYKYIPFGYDFTDAFGHGDWSNMFVSKLLSTRKGNCHSLPYLYKILAEEMGVEANLALAPNHVYIKHRSIKDGWYNTELTSGIFPIDAWLMASGYVHIDAITNGVYMKALNDKESIALVMIDLAQAYQNKFPDNNGVFVLKCCDAAIQAYPNFAAALILKAETHKAAFEREKNEIEATALYEELGKEYAYIHQLGYRNMPEAMYLNWLTSLQAERDKYENKKLSTFNK
ncbi:MAG: hypothetical protein PSV16_00620 [Flavobacterium sp.]|nr:hypothetical protein [Flavobacterium sp.]